MIDPRSLTDDELVAAANEYIARTVARMNSAGLTRHMFIMLHAGVWESHNGKFEISHGLHFTHADSEEIKLKGGNLFELIDKHKVIAGIPTTPVHQVMPMLAAPTPPPSTSDGAAIEEGEFTPIDELPDDVPF
jgi:hypothetical protein